MSKITASLGDGETGHGHGDTGTLETGDERRETRDVGEPGIVRGAGLL